MSISLKIFSPDQAPFDTTAARVVLPILKGTLTILERRAPRSEMLTAGEILLLDEQNKTFQKIKISGGLAEISEDICRVATETFEILA